MKRSIRDTARQFFAVADGQGGYFTAKQAPKVGYGSHYQHCKLVMELAKPLNIELLFLPSHSPNLNIIERL